MSKSRLLLPAAIAALLLAIGPASMAQDTGEHHDSAAPGGTAQPLPGGASGTDAAPGQGAAGGMPSGGMGMGMMGMGPGMMDPSHMQRMHEMMMRMHAPSAVMQGGMGMMPAMPMGMAPGPGMMPGMGMPGTPMWPGMGMMPGMPMSAGMGMIPGMGMPGMGMPPGMAETALLAGEDPLAAGLAAINRRMHREMSQPGSGDADIDFARAMVAHHKGAVDMARLALAFGDDPEIGKLAEGVIAAQSEEIRTLEAWLQRHQP